MNVYYNNTFEGHYPVGVAAVVIAQNPEIAADMLNEHLKSIGLEQEDPVVAAQMTRITTATPKVVILNDGNY